MKEYLVGKIVHTRLPVLVEEYTPESLNHRNILFISPVYVKVIK